MAQQHQNSPDQIIEIPNDPTPDPNPTSEEVVVHLPAGNLYHRYPSTSTPSASPKHKATTFRSIACWTLFAITIIVLSFLIFVFVAYVALRPKNPKFSISDFTTLQSKSINAVDFKLVLIAENPNAHMGLYVKQNGREFAVLYLNRREVGRGLPPDVYLRKSNTTTFEVLLRGLQDRTMWEIWGKEMRFEMDVKVKLKLWLVKVWDMKMDVKCSFKASRQPVNGTHILAQSCRDKIKF